MLTTYGGESTVKTKEVPRESAAESKLRARCVILESQIEVLKKHIDVLEKLNQNNEEWNT